MKQPMHKQKLVTLAVLTALVGLWFVLWSGVAFGQSPPFVPFPGPLGNTGTPGGGGGGGGGTVTGTGAANEVAFWTSATNISSEAAFGYDPATNILTADTMQGANGTAAAPSFAFSSAGNTDNGMYLSAANEISWSTAGTQRMVIDATGQVGINVAAPLHQLHVVDTALASTESALNVTATLNSTVATQIGSDHFITGAGNSTQTVVALRGRLEPGYTGSQASIGIAAVNGSAGTGTSVALFQRGNFALLTEANGTTTGTNLGFYSRAYNGNINYGSFSTADNSGLLDGKLWIGGHSYASLNGRTGTLVGHHVRAQGGVVSEPSIANGAALIIEKDSTALALMRVIDTSVEVFQMSNGGAVVGNVASGATADFRWHTDTNTSGIFLDVGSETIDFVGGSGSTGCSIDASGNLTCAGTISGTGALSGSGANTQVVVWSGASTVVGDAGFTYVTGTNTLTVDGVVINTTGVVDADSDIVFRNNGADGMAVTTDTLSFTAGTNSSMTFADAATGSLVLNLDGSSFFSFDVATGAAFSSGIVVSAADDIISAQHIVGTDELETCAAGVVTIDPVSDYVSLDPAGAACAVTFAETNARAAAIVTIEVFATAGAGLVTFPNSAGLHAGPTLCTTTGVAENAVYTVAYSPRDLMWKGGACTQN